MSEVNAQKAHYERILETYDAHYYDHWSMRYREEFIFDAMWRGLDFNGKLIADLACGSGQNSAALLRHYPEAKTRGFDISPSACAAYTERVGAPAYECDLTRSVAVDEKFDAAMVVGGLHHLVADLPRALENIASLLKPGAIFMMQEPNSRFFLEAVRNVWYRLDSSFDYANEHALDHDALLASANGRFRPLDVTYFGGPAYFGVLNSMILRVPLKLKPAISPPLMAVERVWNRLPGKWPHNVFLARWIRA